MPTYSSRCSKCNTEIDYIARIADRDDTPTHCSTKTVRVVTAAMVPQVGIACGRSAEYKEMAKKNIVPASDMSGEAEHRMKAIKQDQAQSKREIVKNIVLTH